MIADVYIGGMVKKATKSTSRLPTHNIISAHGEEQCRFAEKSYVTNNIVGLAKLSGGAFCLLYKIIQKSYSGPGMGGMVEKATTRTKPPANTDNIISAHGEEHIDK